MASFKSQRGNILFLILLAVVLFAALSYAVTQSLRGGGNDAGNEKATAQASDLLNYFAQIDSAVQRMMVINDIQDYQLNFKQTSGTAFVYGSNDNTNCTENRCRVFEPAGGGVIGRNLSSFTRDPANAAANTVNTGRIIYTSITNVGSSAPDIAFTVSGVSKKMCLDINAKFNATDALSLTYNTNGIMYQNAIPTGPIPSNISTMTTLPAAAAITGTFCSIHPSITSWEDCFASSFCPTIWHVLVAR